MPLGRDSGDQATCTTCGDGTRFVAFAGSASPYWSMIARVPSGLRGGIRWSWNPGDSIGWTTSRSRLNTEAASYRSLFLAAIAWHAIERGANGMVLTAFPVPKVVNFYVGHGARRGAPPDWPHDQDMVPLTFDEAALVSLRGSLR